jgi:simple sugar transport system permease protein
LRGLGHVEGLPIIAVWVVLVAIFMAAAPQVFLHWPIYRSFLTTVPPVLLLSLGLTLVIAAGEIDLSFPSVIAFSGYLMAMCLKDWELPWLAVPLALLGGALVGWTNGVLVAIVGVPAIIATLATQFFWSGLTTGLSGGISYSLRTADQYAVWHLFVGDLGGVPVQALWALAVAVVLWFVLNRHRFGEHLLFIGDNERVARVVGIQVEREKIKLFTLMGILGGLAACLLTLENKNFFNTQGQGYLLTALAAVFIGGTSIFGGQGTIVGSVFGAFIITMIEAGLVATGIQGFWVRAVEGVVFLGAVIFHLVVEDRGRVVEVWRRFGLLRRSY